MRGLFVPLLRSMPKLYIIAGCNGAGKTTASYTVLPEMLGCREFVNADEIAKGLSPFNPESVAIEAGRLMLQRMDDLLSEGEDFAFETTLATRSYVKFVERAQAKGYFVTLLYFLVADTRTGHRACCDTSKRGRTQYSVGCDSATLCERHQEFNNPLYSDLQFLDNLRQQLGRRRD